MAESSDAQAQLLVILNGAILNYMYVSVLALYSFDVFLMVPSEVRLMWQGKPRITTLLYFTARYFLVPRVIIQLGQVPVPAKTMQHSTVYNGRVEYMYASQYISGIDRASVGYLQA
ncbi:hypothetical protein K439DRAFT_979605 [Ramaria rubella]|nr:hypothetical protein K439DRAFT_979605 [Ramaria rubella]